MAVEPSKGTCTFAMAFEIDKGSFGSASLDGLGFVVLGRTPEAMGINPEATEPLRLSNTGHPASDSLLLDHASKSHVHALGLEWDDVSGKNNGQHSPFDWRGA
jgi:hypothetical protein